MAQTRTHKIGTIYSRVKRLLDKKAMQEDNKPLWYDVYEAFPPKYEPRYDRHLLPYGLGSNVKNMPPPPKILYEEDITRAKYYKAFMPKTDAKPSPTLANTEVIDLTNNKLRTLSQVFIEKHDKLKAEGQVRDTENLFAVTVDALEVDGINLKQAPTQVQADEISTPSIQPVRMKKPNVRNIFKEEDEEK